MNMYETDRFWGILRADWLAGNDYIVSLEQKADFLKHCYCTSLLYTFYSSEDQMMYKILCHKPCFSLVNMYWRCICLVAIIIYCCQHLAGKDYFHSTSFFGVQDHFLWDTVLLCARSVTGILPYNRGVHT